MSHPVLEPTIVFVHGAWHGPWVWERTQRCLADIDTRTVDLPSSGQDPAALGGLHEDAEILRTTVEKIDGPVIVVAHSYGGVVATQALTECTNVARIVYLSAFALDEGESLCKVIGREPFEWWDVHLRENYVDTRAPEKFYTDCTEAQTTEAISRLTHQSWQSFTDEVTAPAWRSIPSTYVICTQDQALLPLAQSVLSARATDVRRLHASHSAMISQPDVLADLLRHEIDKHTATYWG